MLLVNRYVRKTSLTRSSGFLLGIVLALLLATFLRFHRLGGQSFWNDEGNSARLSERSIGLIIEGTASDIHPPLYYLLLRGWRELVGETEFGLRSLSALAGVGVVAVTMALGWRLFGRWVALVAGMVAAVNPALVYYSQEARMYELLALWAGLSSWLLLLWLRRVDSVGAGRFTSVEAWRFAK
jgi:mannosyltransferase